MPLNTAPPEPWKRLPNIEIGLGEDLSDEFEVSYWDNWSKVIFTVKKDLADADDDAVVQVVLSNPPSPTDGLVRFNGQATTLTDGHLTYSTSGLDVFVKASRMLQVASNVVDARCFYDVRVILNNGWVPYYCNPAYAFFSRLPTQRAS